MTKWTPGPWFSINEGSKDEPMMSVKTARIAGRPWKRCVAICATGDSPQEMEDANARLIAAAPDLYEATNWIDSIQTWAPIEAIKDEDIFEGKLTGAQIRKLINARKKAEGLA